MFGGKVMHGKGWRFYDVIHCCLGLKFYYFVVIEYRPFVIVIFIRHSCCHKNRVQYYLGLLVLYASRM